MPVHDWTKVGQVILHAFHYAWITEIQGELNGGVLPAGYCALAEQVTGEIAPDVLALELLPRREEETEDLSYARLRRTVVIRHATDHRVVALIEILSLETRRPLRSWTGSWARPVRR